MATAYNIRIVKSRVIDEVQKTTEYIGSKSMGAEDTEAFDRVRAVDADREQLDRYWMESCALLTTSLGRWLASTSDQGLGHHYEAGRNYTATLMMPSNWNSALGLSVVESLTGYLVNMIVSKWCRIAAPAAADTHAAQASAYLEDAQRKLSRRVKPERNSN